jgi:CheY-like chemotaxis protein
MPGMNGDQLAASIHQHSPDTPIIMLSGFGDQLNETNELPEGVSLVVSKPLTLGVMRDALSRIVG